MNKEAKQDKRNGRICFMHVCNVLKRLSVRGEHKALLSLAYLQSVKGNLYDSAENELLGLKENDDDGK